MLYIVLFIYVSEECFVYAIGVFLHIISIIVYYIACFMPPVWSNLQWKITEQSVSINTLLFNFVDEKL